MNAKLIWITPDAETLLGYIARVSNPNNQDNPDVAEVVPTVWGRAVTNA